jgi:hypothetical protein
MPSILIGYELNRRYVTGDITLMIMLSVLTNTHHRLHRNVDAFHFDRWTTECPNRCRKSEASTLWEL